MFDAKKHEYFVRVYEMKDGSKVEIHAVYQTYGQALDEIMNFVDIEHALSMSVEKRYSIKPLWDVE